MFARKQQFHQFKKIPQAFCVAGGELLGLHSLSLSEKIPSLEDGCSLKAIFSPFHSISNVPLHCQDLRKGRHVFRRGLNDMSSDILLYPNRSSSFGEKTSGLQMALFFIGLLSCFAQKSQIPCQKTFKSFLNLKVGRRKFA